MQRKGGEIRREAEIVKRASLVAQYLHTHRKCASFAQLCFSPLPRISSPLLSGTITIITATMNQTLSRLVASTIFALLLLLMQSPLNGQPNVLLIIADDLGVDALGMYGIGADAPITPHLDQLRSEGLLYTNVWSYPTCTPTRAAIASGLYSGKTGVLGVPGTLELSYRTIFEFVAEASPYSYANAVIGKWHIGDRGDEDHPNDQGVDHYVGYLNGEVPDYREWTRTENGTSAASSSYITTELTDEAIEWLGEQVTPWFLWVAHVAPHSPFHLPPDSLYSRTQTNGVRSQYLAMVESFDHEVGRILAAIPETERDSTVIIVVGDNGTPGKALQAYPDGHAKGTLYEGGIRVPMIVAGRGVTRAGETESGLVNLIDLYATIAEIAGIELEGGINNSRTLLPTFTDPDAPGVPFNFIEYDSEVSGWTIRDERYKLIVFSDQSREFYDLSIDPLEERELMAVGLDADQEERLRRLEEEAAIRLTNWSCSDGIRNGDEEGIDCGGSLCEPCISGVVEPGGSSIAQLTPIIVADHILIDLPATSGQSLEVRIYDPLGRVVLRRSVTPHNRAIPTADLAPGFYLVEVWRDGEVVARGGVAL